MIFVFAFVALATAACPVYQVACNRICPENSATTCDPCPGAEAKGFSCCQSAECACDVTWMNADRVKFTGECGISVVLPPIECKCAPATKAACEAVDKMWIPDSVVVDPTKLILPTIKPQTGGNVKRCVCIAPVGGKCVDKLVVVVPPIECKCATKSDAQVACEAKPGFSWVVNSKDVPLPAPVDPAVPGTKGKRCSCIALPAGTCVQQQIVITPPTCDCRSEEQRKCEATIGGKWVVNSKDVPLPAPVDPAVPGTKGKRCSCVAPLPGTCIVGVVTPPCECPVMTDVQNCFQSGKVWAAEPQVLPNFGTKNVKRCSCLAPIGKCVDPVCVCPAIATKCESGSVFVSARAGIADSVCKCDLGRCTPIDVPVPIYCTTSKCLHDANSCAAIKGAWTDATSSLKVFNSACGCGVCTIKKVFDVKLNTVNADLKAAITDKINGQVDVKTTSADGVTKVEVTTTAGASGDGSSDTELINALKSSGVVSEAKIASASEIGAITDAPASRSSSVALNVSSSILFFVSFVASLLL